MTVFYPDVSQFQAGLRLNGVEAVCARATEGNWLHDPTYGAFSGQAQSLGIFQFAYHFLEAGSTPASQAAFCHSVVGNTPLMLDFEPISGMPAPAGRVLGSSLRLAGTWKIRRLLGHLGGYISEPTMTQALGFVDAFRAAGGKINLVYFPHWYWQTLGSPSLQPFTNRGLHLVSSLYTIYSDTGPGWAPYGGASPLIWQYSSSVPLDGYHVDFNAFRGTLPELKSYVTAGVLPPTPQPPPPKPKPPQPPQPPQPAYSEDSMVVLTYQAGVNYSLPVPAGKTKILLYADPDKDAHPQVRAGCNPNWDGAHTLLPNWGAPAVWTFPKGAVEITLSRIDGGPAPVTVDWA